MATCNNIAVGPLAMLLRKGIISPRARVRGVQANSDSTVWRDLIGSIFLYTAANWGAVSVFFEVYLRPTSAKALARLWDVTAGAEVANSTITFDSAGGVLLVPTRLRSSALTLVDGHEYRTQVGVQDGGAGAIVGAKLIAV